jgi:hypothetical protein
LWRPPRAFRSGWPTPHDPVAAPRRSPDARIAGHHNDFIDRWNLPQDLEGALQHPLDQGDPLLRGQGAGQAGFRLVERLDGDDGPQAHELTA